jgi:hypothetical protein
MEGRLDNLKALNTDRWKAHAQGHADAAAGDDARDRDQLLSSATTTPTGGALFNLANPTNDGEFVKPYIRNSDAQAVRYRGELIWIDPKTYERVPMPANGGRDWMRTREVVPSSGDDWTSVRLSSVHKYRIPSTSVTRKQGDCQLLGCCGWRLTGAQWVWCAVTRSNHPSSRSDPDAHLPRGLLAGGSTSCASARTRPWSSSPSGWPTGGTARAHSATRST